MECGAGRGGSGGGGDGNGIADSYEEAMRQWWP